MTFTNSISHSAANITEASFGIVRFNVPLNTLWVI